MLSSFLPTRVASGLPLHSEGFENQTEITKSPACLPPAGAAPPSLLGLAWTTRSVQMH